MPLRILVMAICVFVVVACGQKAVKPEKNKVKQAEIPTESINIGHRKALAQEYFQQQDYHAAMTQWKVLRAIDPKNPEYVNRIRVLEALVKRRIKLYLKQGKEQLLEDDLPAAEKSLLKALALDPNNYFALKMMRQIEAKRVQRVQMAKTKRLLRKQKAKFAAEQKRREKLEQNKRVTEESEITAKAAVNSQEAVYLDMGKVLFKQGDWSGAIREINKFLSSNESTQEIRSILKQSHINMSQLFETRGHWDPAIQHLNDAIDNTETPQELADLKRKRTTLKTKAAEDYYIEGVKIYRDNVDRAILFWQQALNHDPSHLKAKNRLRKAEKIQQNLKLINR